MLKGKKTISTILAASLLSTLAVVPTVSAVDGANFTYGNFEAVYPIYPYGDTVLLQWQPDAVCDKNNDENASDIGFAAEFKVPSINYIKNATLRMVHKSQREGTNTAKLYQYFGGWDEATASYNSLNAINNIAEKVNWIKNGTSLEAAGITQVAVAENYELGDGKAIYFDVTDNIKVQGTEDIGFLVSAVGYDTFYQYNGEWDGKPSSGMPRRPRLDVTYDIDAYLADINAATSASDREAVDKLISENGEIIEIYRNAYNVLADKSTVIDAVIGKTYDKAVDFTVAVNTAIDELIYYTPDIAVTTTGSGTQWSYTHIYGGYNQDSTTDVTVNYSEYPSDYRAIAKLYFRTNSGRGNDDVKIPNRTQQVIDVETNKAVGYVNAQGEGWYGGDILPKDNMTAYYLAKEVEECFDNFGVNQYVNLGYDKTAILKAINTAETVAEIRNILTDYGKMISSDINSENAGKYAIGMFYYDEEITFDNIADIAENLDTILDNNLIYMINEADTLDKFVEMVEGNAQAIGIDLTLYSKLSGKADIMASIYEAKPEGGYRSTDVIKDAFNAAVSERINQLPMRAIAFEDYNCSSTDAVNGENNWASALLLKYKIGKAVNTTSHHIIKIGAMQRFGNHGAFQPAERGYMLYEVSPDGWTDLPATTQEDIGKLNVVNDESKLIATGISEVGSGSRVELDVTDYFLNENNEFNKNPDEVFALKFKTDSRYQDNGFAFYTPTDGDWSKYDHYLEFYYDTEAILNEINSAKTADEVGEIIAREGSVIGIKMSAYENILYKDAVNEALLNKSFVNIAEASAAANAALDSLLYTETVKLESREGWGIINLNTDNIDTANPENFYVRYGNDYMNYITFDLSNMKYNNSDAVYAEVNLANRAANEDTAVRIFNLSDAKRFGNVVGVATNSTLGASRSVGDITPIIKNATDKTATVYFSAPVLTGARDFLESPISNLAAGMEYSGDRFYVNVAYDKLALIDKITKAGNVESANNLLTEYSDELGLTISGDFTKYSTVLLGKTVKTLAQFNKLLEEAESATVVISDLTLGTVGAGMTTTSGTIYLANLSGSMQRIAVIIASYDENGRMVDSIVVDTDNGEGDPRLPKNGQPYPFRNLGIENASEVRAYVWDSLERMNPHDKQMVKKIAR